MSAVSKDDIEMDGLTAEERASLQDMMDNPDSETATVGDLAGDAETAAAAELEAENQPAAEVKDATKPEETATEAAAAAVDGDAAATPAAKDEPDAAAEAAAEPAPATQPAPLLVVQAPADVEAKLKEIGDKRADLRKRYDAGDITFDEYDGQKDELAKQERTIERQIDKAQMAADLQEQQRRNEWAQQCESFVTDHPEYNTDKDRFDHLNETIKAIAKMPRYQNLTGPQYLAKAHALVQVEFGESAAPAAAAAAAPAAAAKPAPKAPPVAPKLPPNLAHVPAASATEAGEGRYANLDRLQSTNPMAYEEALAKMSESEQSAYLAST